MRSILDCGADVDSRSIVIACAAHSFATQRIANERHAIVSWLDTVPRESRLAMEATGDYHQLLAELAVHAGLQVFVVNPHDLRRYAQSIGRRGKTDRLDAEVIARYVSREHSELHAYVVPSKQQRAFARLIRRRDKLVEAKAALVQSLRGMSGMRQELEKAKRTFEHLIEAVEKRMDEALKDIPAARQTAERIAEIPGFGALTSAWLAYSFIRLPYPNSDAVVAAAGLDPRPDDSGQKTGRRRLSKRGPALTRKLLFNCARSAARGQLWKPYYHAQLAKGLSKTAATVVLARKMLRVAFALFKQNRSFEPALIGAHACKAP